MTRDFRAWWIDDEGDGGGDAPRKPAPGKVTLTQHIQRRARPDVRPSQKAAEVAPFGFVQAYGGEVKPTSAVAFPDEHPVSFLAVQADQAWHAAFNFDYGKPVQRAASLPASGDADTVHATAARGIEAPSESLPHLDQIQKSFGHHDVSHVQAHVGGAAAEASAAMGAEAYATGHHVAFERSPDLHTAAHEAAHVVQQKGDVQLKGGVGEVGDAYERHADAVADKVVAGESAEALLDEVAGGAHAGAPKSQAVQRETKKGDGLAGFGPKPPSALTGWQYFLANREKFVLAIAREIANAGFVSPVKGMHWVGSFEAPFAAGLRALLDDGWAHSNMEAILYPANTESLIDQYRPLTKGNAGESIDGSEAMGPPTWQPLAGQALGIEAVQRMRESLMRLGPRYAVQAEEARGKPVRLEDLVTSHPMDRIVAQLLCDPSVTTYRAPKAGGKKPHGAQADTDHPSDFRYGVLFPTDYAWLGEKDPKLWNWIHVKEPDGVTPEGVAAVLFPGDGPLASHQAYGITASPPFFRIPPEWARLHDAAKNFEPAEAEDDWKSGPAGKNALDLADSAFATEAAFAQAKDELKVDRRGIPLPPDLEEMRSLLERSQRQLERAADQLAPWGITWMVGPATRWTGQQHDTLAANPDERLIKLRPVLDGQQSLLFEAVGAVAELDQMARGAGIQPGTPEAVPFANVLKLFAGTIGQSHLIDTAREHLKRARAAQAVLPLDLVDRSLRESHAAVRALPAADGHAAPPGTDLQAQHQGLMASNLGLRRQFNAGQPPDAASVEALVISARENAFKGRLASLGQTIDGLQAALWAADDSTIEQMATVFTFHDEIRDLPNLLGTVRQEIWQKVQSPMEKETTAAFSDPAFTKAPDDQKSAESNRLRGRILDTAERRLMEILTKHKFDQIEYKVLDTITNQQIRTLVVTMVIMIGVSVAGGMAGSIVGGAVRGALLKDAAAGTLGLLRGARMAQAAGAIVGTGVDAGVNTVGDVVIGGDATGAALFRNFATNAAVLAALRPMQDAAAAWRVADDDLKNLKLWERVKHGTGVALRKGVPVTGETLGAAAISYLVERAQAGGKPPDDKTAVEWAMQGASMALGRFISGRLSGLEDRLGQAMADTAHLKGRVTRLKSVADDVSKLGNHDQAMDLMAQDRLLHQEEARFLEELAKHPPRGLNPQTLASLRAGNYAATHGVQGFAYDTMPLRSAGLEPDDASGKVWVGDRDTIDVALDRARQANIEVLVHEHDVATGRWRVAVGSVELTIVEGRSRTHANKASAGHGAKPDEVGHGRKTGPLVMGEHVEVELFDATRKASESQDGVEHVSPIHVDPTTNTAYFDVYRRGGMRQRIPTTLPERIESAAQLVGLSNRIIGRPIGSAEAGLQIMRAANRGDLSAFAKLGVEVPPGTTLAGGIEFGLGKLSDGRYVIIRGEPAAVDWKLLPGVEPLAHTHPLTAGNVPRAVGVDHIAMVDIADPNDFALDPRNIIYPSAPDIVVVAQRGVKEHRVLTELVVNRGKVEAPQPGDDSPRLEWVIRKAEFVGTIPGSGDVYKALVVGEVGGRAVVRHEVWAVHPSDGSGRPGDIYTKDPSPQTPAKPRAPLTPEQQARLDARRSELTSLLAADVAKVGGNVEVRVLDASEFRARFRSEKGRAVFVLEDGVERVYVREDGSPDDVRHELTHVKQLQDVTIGAEIRKLHHGDLENWDELSTRDRMGQFLRKLHVEIEAAQRNASEGSSDGDGPATPDASHAKKLAALRALEARALAIGDDELSQMSAGLREEPDFLKDPAWLFTKVHETIGDRQDRYNRKTDTPLTHLPDTGIDRSAAYTSLKHVKSVARVGTEWTEVIHVSSDHDGIVSIRGENTDKVTVVVTGAAGKEHFYALEKGAQLRVADGMKVKPGDLLADEKNRRYRLVEIEFSDGRPPDMREETFDVTGRWVQRGSESTRRGGIAEHAARLQADANLAKTGVGKLEVGGVSGYRRVKHQRGGGGFDDVILLFSGTPEKPRVLIKIREVKDYPDKYVPLEEFTAIRPRGLVENLQVLRTMADDALTKLESGTDLDGDFSGMTVKQVEAIRDAVDDLNLEIEIVISPTTKVGRESRSEQQRSVLRELRKEIIAATKGKDVLAGPAGDYEPERVDAEHMNQATRSESEKK